MPVPRLAAVLRSLLVLALSAAVLSAQQKGQGSPKYDVRAETKMKGTVEELKLPPKGSERDVVHMLVKDGPDSLDIYLCPGSFLKEMGITFQKGDEIALTGSKVKQGEADLVLAREVVRGSDTLVLRDAKGSPIWSWHK